MKREKDYLYVSANFEAETGVTFRINSENYFRNRCVHMK